MTVSLRRFPDMRRLFLAALAAGLVGIAVSASTETSIVILGAERLAERGLAQALDHSYRKRARYCRVF